jgi:hypothetical protein
MVDHRLSPSTDRGGRNRDSHVSSSDLSFPPPVALPPSGIDRQDASRPSLALATGGAIYLRQSAVDRAGRPPFVPPFAAPPAFERAEDAKVFYQGLPGVFAIGAFF